MKGKRITGIEKPIDVEPPLTKKGFEEYQRQQMVKSKDIENYKKTTDKRLKLFERLFTGVKDEIEKLKRELKAMKIVDNNLRREAMVNKKELMRLRSKLK